MEPEIIIDGLRLTEGQSMAVRVAIGSYAMEMSVKGALGDDDTGEAIRKGYRDRLAEVGRLMAP